MEKYLNTEQFEFYKKYEDVFNTAVFGNFKHRTNILTDKRLGDIYTQVTGDRLDSFSCNTCNLRNYVKMGKLYYATKTYLENHGRSNKTGNGEITTKHCSGEGQVNNGGSTSEKGHTERKVSRTRSKKTSE